MHNLLEKHNRCLICGKSFEGIQAVMCNECLERDPRDYCKCCKRQEFYNSKDGSKSICTNCGHIKYTIVSPK